MKNKILAQGIILTLLLVFAGFAYQTYAYNKPAYYGQHNYRYNYAYNSWPYIPVNAFRGSGAANYVGGYGNHGWSPFLMPSTCNSWSGCGNNYNSHIYVEDPLTYTYYKNPWLLEPRRMDNHQWMVRGVWPQKFYY